MGLCGGPSTGVTVGGTPQTPSLMRGAGGWVFFFGNGGEAPVASGAPVCVCVRACVRARVRACARARARVGACACVFVSIFFLKAPHDLMTSGLMTIPEWPHDVFLETRVVPPPCPVASTLHVFVGLLVSSRSVCVCVRRVGGMGRGGAWAKSSCESWSSVSPPSHNSITRGQSVCGTAARAVVGVLNVARAAAFRRDRGARSLRATPAPF